METNSIISCEGFLAFQTITRIKGGYPDTKFNFLYMYSNVLRVMIVDSIIKAVSVPSHCYCYCGFCRTLLSQNEFSA